MGKYSVIIPTLWKSNRIGKLLFDLIKCEFVDEIILIDNGGKFFEYYEGLNKVKLVQVEENIYVNPAWNLGVKLAKNNNIAILNDDINFDPNIFELITEDILSQFGIIGMGEGNYKESINQEIGPCIDVWHPGINDWGWGCFIMLHKKYWIDIPENIKIWYGDNFIKDINPAPKGILRNFKVETEMSTTSDEKEWDERKKEDQVNFLKLFVHG
jgi:hypothetical protein